MFFGLFREDLCPLSLMTCPLRDWLAILLMVAFNYLEGVSKLLYVIKMACRAFPYCLYPRTEGSLWEKQNNPGDFALKR